MKKQITDPVRNKTCNHIYGKSTIYGMIEQVTTAPVSRSDPSPPGQGSGQAHQIRCPSMGCNQKDFKKTDLLKDKEGFDARISPCSILCSLEKFLLEDKTYRFLT